MNKVCFTAMQAQLRPSVGAEAALRRRLAESAPRRRPRWQYLTAAACAALLLCAYPVYQALTAPPRHSYVLLETGTAGQDSTAVTTPEDAPVDAPPASATSPGPDARPYEGEGTAAYQTLMDAFGGSYPDWYGGAYLNGEGRLVVLAVEGTASALPDSLQDSDAVVLEHRARYAYAHLLGLQEQVVDAMLPLGLFNGCGVDEEANRLYLALREADREALTLLAKLDPEDDAIYVEITPRPAVLDAAADSVPAEDVESPALYFADPGGGVPNEDNAIAYEPFDPS